MSGRSPPLFCTFTLLIAMQGHQKNIKNKPVITFRGSSFSFTYYVIYVLIPGIDYVIRGMGSLLRETNLMSRGPPTCHLYLRSNAPSVSSIVVVLLLFLTFSVLVANPKKLLYTVANPARGLLNREKRTKEKVWQHTPPPPPPTLLVRRK